MSTPTVLVVDDEPQIRRVMRTTLSSNGYTVLEARSGEEALDILRKEQPDLILLDVNMPGRSGLKRAVKFAISPTSPSSCLPFATRSMTRCWRWMLAPTTMWSITIWDG